MTTAMPEIDRPTAEELKDKALVRVDDDEELMLVNFGPAHPASHGTLRILGALSGEKVIASAVEIGYLHRGFEKMVEQGQYMQVIPYTDRLNYNSALMNNHGYCKAVERMMEITIPDRARLLRVILSEMSRIIDHLISCGAALVDLGALTNFWYFFNAREHVYTIIEKICGARLTTSHSRIGGLMRDVYDGFEEDVIEWLDRLDEARADVLGLILNNKIFIDRTRWISIVSGESALSYGYTGPCLRASGINYDLRKQQPYDGYEEFDFDIPIGKNGDNYDRLMVRFEEIGESVKIVRQALEKLRPGPVMVDDARVRFPEKKDVYFKIESMVNQFELVFKGIEVPEGELYDFTEAANGELGFYIVSDGSGRPYRIKVRPPCYYIFGNFSLMVEDQLIADAMTTLGTVNIIAGELDR
jgi:NADH dehydrogenase I D subunit